MNAAMNVTEVNVGTVQIYHGESPSANGSLFLMVLSSPVNKFINITSIITLFVTMIGLGCTMEISKIRSHLLKPKEVAIALMAQFGIMPLTAFCLTKLLQMDTVKALTVLICGCCPGGTLSNIFALALQGDMNLSIVMTTCSSFAALGLMPLLLFLYCQGIPNLENAVPYAGIITALALILVPCAIGIAVNHFKPNYTVILLRTGVAVMTISTVVVLFLSFIYIGEFLWMIIMPDVLAVAALMPLIGFMLGFVLSAACRSTHVCSRTVAMETGCQNVNLCFAILKVTFPPEVIGPMFLFPLLYFTFQLSEALLLTVCFRCYQRSKTPADVKKLYLSVDDKQAEVHFQGQKSPQEPDSSLP